MMTTRIQSDFDDSGPMSHDGGSEMEVMSPRVVDPTTFSGTPSSMDSDRHLPPVPLVVSPAPRRSMVLFLGLGVAAGVAAAMVVGLLAGLLGALYLFI